MLRERGGRIHDGPAKFSSLRLSRGTIDVSRLLLDAAIRGRDRRRRSALVRCHGRSALRAAIVSSSEETCCRYARCTYCNNLLVTIPFSQERVLARPLHSVPGEFYATSPKSCSSGLSRLYYSRYFSRRAKNSSCSFRERERCRDRSMRSIERMSRRWLARARASVTGASEQSLLERGVKQSACFRVFGGS